MLANELKNNACKLAKWTVQAILAGADILKFGYEPNIAINLMYLERRVTSIQIPFKNFLLKTQNTARISIIF